MLLHLLMNLGFAGGTAAASLPAGVQFFALPPTPKRPTIVFEQQNNLYKLVAVTTQLRDTYYAGRYLPAQQDRTFIGQNLLLTTLTPVVANLPAGEQSYPDFLRKTLSNIDLAQQNLLLTTLAQVAQNPPEGEQRYPDTLWKNPATIVFEQQNTLNTLLSPPEVVTAPVGAQVYPDSTWKYKQVLTATQGNITVSIADVFPVGKQLYDSKLPYKSSATSFESINLLGTLLAVTGTFIISPSGGITFSGNAALVKEDVIEPTGSIAFSGTAPGIKEDLIPPSGQITFSGSAPITFTPAGGATVIPQLPMTGAGHS